ncbi:MAG: PIG-L family deacetylase, partial [Gemmatimonadota bacterium]|nr:PIG-L family deacetylase [Gemmatimonadota bacterium]
MRLKVVAQALLLSLQWVGASAQLAPPGNGGVAELDRLLQQVSQPMRLLVVGAHPDDEDTALLALMAWGYGADAAYLSLSRGEGGQNLIGTELGVDLGLIRTRELLSARSIDGARQFFTRAYDFGYTRSIEETHGFWHPDSLLKDVVRVVRRFRPHVIVSVFSGTPRDGHGQHQAAGIAAMAAFDAAARADAFPELAEEEGLEPWEPLKLYRSTRFDSTATTLSLKTGGLDPRFGRSHYQIAMESRSRHRSQDMGRLQLTGPHESRVALLRDRTGAGEDDSGGIFAGIGQRPAAYQERARRLRGQVRTVDPGELVGDLAELHRLAVSDGASDSQLRKIESALAIAAGLVVDAVAERSMVIPGESLEIEGSIYNGGPETVELISVTARTLNGWDHSPAVSGVGEILPGAFRELSVSLTSRRDLNFTQGYFLDRPLGGFLYDWTGAPAPTRGEAFQEPQVSLQFLVRVSGVEVRLLREASHRILDQAIGEIREEVRVVPKVDVRLEPSTVVWPSDVTSSKKFEVALVYNGEGR